MLSPGFRVLYRNHVFLVLLVLLVATALRLTALGRVPPGLYHDEAYNGLDALKVLDGDLSLYFSANNGREPMFIYLIALSVGLLGRSPFAVRLAAFGPGLLTIAVTYALARTLFSRRVGLLSAAVLSVTLWHIHLSRVGFRAVLLPLFIGLAVWQGALGWRTGRRRHWLLAGALYGMSFYTYVPARFSPVALLLFGLYLLWARADHPARKNLAPLAWSLMAMLAALAPLALFAIAHPDLVLSRTGQVSILNSEIHGGDFWGTLLRHTGRTLGMFFVKGDRIWRHNVPWRPVFDPLLGLFFLIGLARALRHFRRDPALAFLIIWTATMTLPTLLAEDAPHFLRGVGVLPLAALFPALGIDWLLRTMEDVSRNTRRVTRVMQFTVRVIPPVVLSISLISTATAYFGDYARADMAAYWFEDGAVELAGDVNGYLGVGWDGERMLPASSSAGQQETSAGREVFIESGLWNTWTAVPFLIGESPAVNILEPGQTWPTVGDGPAAVFVWPYGDWKRVWAMLDVAAEIRVEEGARSQGDRDPEPFITYLGFYVAPVQSVQPALARFQGGVKLVSAVVHVVDEGVRVELSWHATADLPDDYTVFVHYMRDEQRVGQDDAQPAGGRYPTSRWRVGDIVHDTHVIPVLDAPDPTRDGILVGLYRAVDGQHLDLLDQAGNPAGVSLALPLSEVLR